jgi:hypothetical protein
MRIILISTTEVNLSLNSNDVISFFNLSYLIDAYLLFIEIAE